MQHIKYHSWQVIGTIKRPRPLLILVKLFNLFPSKPAYTWYPKTKILQQFRLEQSGREETHAFTRVSAHKKAVLENFNRITNKKGVTELIK